MLQSHTYEILQVQCIIKLPCAIYFGQYHVLQVINQECTPILNSSTDMELSVLALTYPIMILDVEISSLLNKVLHCVNVAIPSCTV